MGEQIFHSGKPSGFQNENQNDAIKGIANSNDVYTKQKGKDDDLIIEENTVYEIDRECYDRIKKQKRR